MNRVFYGRHWVFEKIKDVLETTNHNSERKYKGISIVGQLGSGKTSICLQLIQANSKSAQIQKELSEKVIGYHLCHSHDQISLDTLQFIRNLSLQLSQHQGFANYSKYYHTSEIQDLLNKDHKDESLVNLFNKVILDPLKSRTETSQRFLLIVDSVDECLFDAREKDNCDNITICDLLVASLQQNSFPPWLYLLVTARRQSKEVMKKFSGLRKVTLDDLKKSYVVKDAQQYILDRLDNESDLRKHLTRDTAEKFNLLHVKSNGCILYLEKILDNVINGTISMNEVSEIPGTLNGLYLWLCQKLFTEDFYSNNLRPVLEILLAARRTLSLQELFSIIKLVKSDIDHNKMKEYLDILSPVLLNKDSNYQLFHHSFSEWLIDVKHCTRRYLCNVAKGHAMLALYYMFGGKSLSIIENERFLWHLVQSQYPSSDPSKLDQWLQWSGVKPEEAKHLKVEATGNKVTACETRDSIEIEENDDTMRKKSPKITKDVDDGDWTPLLKASYHGAINEVHFLIQNGADVNFVDRTGKTALAVASGQGHANIVHDLIHCGAEINTRDSTGCTPLREAAKCGSIDIVTLLLKHDAIPDLADNNQRTALRAAAWGGHTDIVLQLLQKGADANHMDKEGRTALIAAAHTGSAEVVEVLLDHDAVINHIDSDGRTALAVSVLSERSHHQLNVIKVLLENGADVDHPDFDGMTPLCLACMLGHEDVVQVLLGKADINHWDRHGRTPLMLACANGHDVVIRILLEYIKDNCDETSKETIFRKDNSSWTPLSIAAFNGYDKVVQLLLFHGALLNEVDTSKRTALMLASQEGHTKVVDQLINAGASTQLRSSEGCVAVHYAAMFGHIDCVEKLLKKECDINIYDHHGNTPLNHAAKQGNSKMCETLLKAGAKVNCQDSSGRTPLHMAAWKGFYNVTEKLIEYGADINHTDTMGYTSLMTAAWQGHTSILSYLLSKNAMVDITSNKDKASALSIAAQEGHEDVVRLLLNHNASYIPDKFGRDPLKVAQQAGNRGVVHILDAFNSVALNDGTFTSTLKKQFSKLMRSQDPPTPSSSPSFGRMHNKSMTRTNSNSSSRGKTGSEEFGNSNTSISSNEPSTSYDDCPSYCGPHGEVSSRLSHSYSNLKQSKVTVHTGSSLEDEVFFGRSISKDPFPSPPFDFTTSYHGCNPVNLKKALEMSSTETTL